jgi:TonB family protein
MKPICREVQDTLAAEGAAALRDDAGAQRHLEECSECFQALERLAQLDEALRALPAIDAPEEAVSAVLAGVKAEGAPALLQPRPAFRWHGVLWVLSAAATVVFAFAMSMPSLLRARVSVRRLPEPAAATPAPAPAPPQVAEGNLERRLSGEEEDRLRSLGYGTNKKAEKEKAVVPGAAHDDRPARHERAQGGKQKGSVDVPVDAPAVAYATDGHQIATTTGPLQDERQRTDGSRERVSDGTMDLLKVGGEIRAPKLLRRVEPAYPAAARDAHVEGVVLLEIQIAPDGSVKAARVLSGHALLDAAALEAVKQWRYEPTAPVTIKVEVKFNAPPAGGENATPPSQPPSHEARQFVEERTATEGVLFQAATGYWANTYLPGDPTLRLLQSRLAGWDHAPLLLHETAAPQAQPFDAPRNAALAVFLHADRGGIDRRSRMLVQVGLRAADRAGAQRPSMTVALVLDLRSGVTTETAAAMRALTLALAHAKQAGDHFSLVVAGPEGGVVVGADEFRHGPLVVALDRLLLAPAGETGFGIADAVAAAYREVCRKSDRDAALGSNAVFLVSGRPFGDGVETLADMAHQGAVAGIPLTAIGVGSEAPLPELEHLALAGQGSRRVLDGAGEARRLIDDELAAAGSAVARAVRLRIRLAQGVQLIGVLGSQRLDAVQAERVREAERSIDLQLAQSLGLEADRGEDEDGIQIVIPSFRAGDAHTILLDVVAAGPGPIADVSVRYKDLVWLRNDVARANLSLAGRSAAPGPLERNVLRNALALRLAQGLTGAAEAVQLGDLAAAAARLEQTRSLLTGIGALVPVLAGDPSLPREAAMLQAYMQLLQGGAGLQIERARLADSLRYAGRIVLLPRPVPLSGPA